MIFINEKELLLHLKLQSEYNFVFQFILSSLSLTQVQSPQWNG